MGGDQYAEVADFLIADGYRLLRAPASHRISAERKLRVWKKEKLELWLPVREQIRIEAAAVLEELRSVKRQKPAATCIVLLPSMTSLGTNFVKDATAVSSYVRSFAYFFDAAFRQTDQANLGVGTGKGSQAASYFRKSLLRPELIGGSVTGGDTGEPVLWRVPQQFFIRDGLEPQQRSALRTTDLFDELTGYITDRSSLPRVTFVIGAAGIGKSVVFSALFTWLYQEFQKAKLQQKEGIRPIPVLPDTLARAPSYSTAKLFAAICETEGAQATRQELLDWSLKSGRCVLMFDGLDEFFSEQDDFFSEMKKRYFSQRGQSHILVFFGDSLLATSNNLRRLVSELLSFQRVQTRIYELARWDADVGTKTDDPRRALIWLRLEGRRPIPGQQETAKTTAVLEKMRNHSDLLPLNAPVFG
jgi:hypothetical protein